AGAAATAVLVFLAGTHRAGAGAFGASAIAVAHGKLQHDLVQAVALGILGNALVCLAVWLSYGARTTTDRVVAIVLPVSAFVAAGFEHSVANMYFFPFALCIAAFDPGFLARPDLSTLGMGLTWSGFLVKNLLPVTLGNILGGTLLVGAVYWFVYLRGRGEASRPKGAR
ncbi:MAG TPA: formate/nitrite transporter family protein, partial [Candidatus Limnocylindrales bacterium]|nr:formate/nitrite transporter family protein [Candidatus Limnocylindrales bacterium]